MTYKTSTIGRFVIDIDGVLKSTNLSALAADDVREVSGDPFGAKQIFWEIYGELLPLGPGDRVTLAEATVAFFHTRAAAVPRSDNVLPRGLQRPQQPLAA